MRLEDLMKKFILTIVFIAFFIYPAVCLSSYLIELKNGSTFITNHHWKEGQQIKFYYRGGVVGIGKDLVRKISESDLPYKQEVVEQKASPVPDTPDVASKEAGKKAGEEVEAAKKTEAKSREIDVEYYRRMNEELWDKYREAKERYDQSKLDRDEFAKNDAKKDIREALDKLTELSRELKKKNKDILPDWWQDKP
jgi:hypothetical protein